MSPITLDNPAIASAVCLLGRLMISAIFFLSGWQKITAPAATVSYMASVGLPFPKLDRALAIVVEIVGGLALVVGYETRLVAAVLAIYSVVTAAFAHRDFRDQNQRTHFFKNMAMAGGLLQIVVLGAGSFSLDAIG
jgi:putative oxidoreductase